MTILVQAIHSSTTHRIEYTVLIRWLGYSRKAPSIPPLSPSSNLLCWAILMAHLSASAETPGNDGEDSAHPPEVNEWARTQELCTAECQLWHPSWSPGWWAESRAPKCAALRCSANSSLPSEWCPWCCLCRWNCLLETTGWSLDAGRRRIGLAR